MDKQIENLAPEIKQAIQGAQSILLHLHPSPDEDSIGSVLAMSQILKRWGKKHTIIGGDSTVPRWAKFFPGGEKIIGQNFGETDLSQYDLFLALDTGGLRAITRAMNKIVFPDHLQIVLIDHHASNESFGSINLIVKTYPATAQIIFDLLKVWGEEINREVALCLFAGLYGDTGGFQYPLTTRESFLAAADLVAEAPDFAKFLSLIRNNQELEKVEFQSLALGRIDKVSSGKVLVAAIDLKLMADNHIERHHTESNGIAATLCTIEGCEIGVSLIEDEQGTRVSFRSKDGEKYDISKVAAALGGGGHKAAAATHLDKFLPESKEIAVNKIKEFYPELFN